MLLYNIFKKFCVLAGFKSPPSVFNKKDACIFNKKKKWNKIFWGKVSMIVYE